MGAFDGLMKSLRYLMPQDSSTERDSSESPSQDRDSYYVDWQVPKEITSQVPAIQQAQALSHRGWTGTHFSTEAEAEACYREKERAGLKPSRWYTPRHAKGD